VPGRGGSVRPHPRLHADQRRRRRRPSERLGPPDGA
jgi:hypothetical protein